MSAAPGAPGRQPFALVLAAVAWVALLATVLLGTVVAALGGWSTHVVTSGSMAPALHVGDLVLVDAGARVPPAGALVMVADPSLADGSYVHRVVDRDGDVLLTRGDANPDADPPVAVDRVRGTVRAVVPGLGRPLVWLREGVWWPAAGAALLTWGALVVALGALPGRRRADRPRLRRAPHPAATAGVLAATVALGAVASTDAAFTATTSNGPSTLQASVWQSYATVVAADAPLGWWRLNETSGTTAAASAGSQVGTYVNAPTLGLGGAITGDSSRSVGLAGTADLRQRITFGTAANFSGTSPFTLEAWVYLTGLPDGWPRVISREDWSTGVQNGWALGINGPTSGYPYNPFCARIDATGGGDWAGSTAPISTNAWHHLVCTYDGSTMRFYVDGEPAQTSPSTRSIPVSSGALAVGGLEWSDFLQGRVDEIALYPAALSPVRVRAHHEAGLAGIVP